ncbi:MAG: EscU/YscU/HrcU family type III secretion system export apparatus switch protein, partial [Lentisphaerota bacterium]
MEGKEGQTERATSKKRGEQRKKGNLCVSPEITTVLVLLLGAFGIRYAVPHIMDQLTGLFLEVLRLPVGGIWSGDLVQRWFISGGVLVAVMLIPIMLPVMIAAVAANMAQTGPYMSTEALHLNFNALNPVKGAKHLFSIQSITTFLLSMLKALLVLWVIYLVTRRRILDIVGLSSLNIAEATQWTFMLIYRMTIAVACLFIFIAALDWVIRKYKHEKNMMMTRKEVEDERKQQ